MLEVRDLLLEAGGHRVQRAPQRTRLVRRAHGHPAIEAALRHLPRDLLHLHDGLRDTARHEDADAGRDRERHESAGEQDAVDRRERGGDFRERQREPHDAFHRAATLHGHGDVEQRNVDGGAAARGPPDLAGESGAHLGPCAVVLHACKIHRRHQGIRDHDTVRADERHTCAGGRRRARRPQIRLGPLRVAGQERLGVVVQQARARGQTLRQRIDGGALERVTQIEPGEEDAHGDERDERERELDRDTPPNEADHEVSPSVSSKR